MIKLHHEKLCENYRGTIAETVDQIKKAVVFLSLYNICNTQKRFYSANINCAMYDKTKQIRSVRLQKNLNAFILNTFDNINNTLFCSLYSYEAKED